MRILKEMFWDNGMWRATVPAAFAGFIIPAVLHMLGLMDNQLLMLIGAISLGALIGLLFGGILRWLKPVDCSKSSAMSTSRRVLKGLAATYAVMSGLFFAYYIFDDRTFWLALVVALMSAGICVWSIRTLLDEDQWDEDGMLKPKRGMA